MFALLSFMAASTSTIDCDMTLDMYVDLIWERFDYMGIQITL